MAAGLGAGIVSRTEFLPDDRLTPLAIADHKPFTESYAACLKQRQELRPIDAFMKLVRARSAAAERADQGLAGKAVA